MVYHAIAGLKMYVMTYKANQFVFTYKFKGEGLFAEDEYGSVIADKPQEALEIIFGFIKESGKTIEKIELYRKSILITKSN